MTLLEIVLALAIFMVTLAVAAQALAGFYTSIDLQEERIEALQAARDVMGALRERRQQYVDDTDPLNDAFPQGWLDWINAQNQAGWPGFARAGAADSTLTNHQNSVAVRDANGDAPTLATTLFDVTVVSRWEDARGRPLAVQVGSLLTDR